MGITLPVRLYLFRQHIDIKPATVIEEQNRFFLVPRSEFYSDILLWSFNAILVLSYLGYHALFLNMPCMTALKNGIAVFFGFIATGLLMGFYNYLEMEKRMIIFLKDQPIKGMRKPDISLSISRKFTFLLISVLLIFAIAIAYILFNNISSLIAKHSIFSINDLYVMFFKILAITIVLLGFSLMIISRLTENIKRLFNLQLAALEKVKDGNYDAKVPIVSNDEFGVVAFETNKMVDGLREREFIRDTFGRYVTKEIRDLILSNKIPLDGEIRSASVLFSDIRNFTSYSESRNPKQVVKKMNQYFAAMTEAIQNNKGLVLQYLGDGIEAVFGAPSYIENHAELAVKAALEMRSRLEGLNLYWKTEGSMTLDHGIGIHTGEVLAGNIGTPERTSYQMMGDTVNLAARIQELNKEYASDILISGETYRLLNNKFNVKNLGQKKVKGKEIETDIYQIL